MPHKSAAGRRANLSLPVSLGLPDQRILKSDPCQQYLLKICLYERKRKSWTVIKGSIFEKGIHKQYLVESLENEMQHRWVITKKNDSVLSFMSIIALALSTKYVIKLLLRPRPLAGVGV